LAIDLALALFRRSSAASYCFVDEQTMFSMSCRHQIAEVLGAMSWRNSLV
jgi:hypothetical protein